MAVSESDPIGYLYRRSVFCPACTSTIALVNLRVSGKWDATGSVEELLDQWAERAGIQRGRLRSYDSWDFPKAVSAVAGSPSCAGCDRRLGGPG